MVIFKLTMQTDNIPYQKIPFLSPLISDYIFENQKLENFYNRKVNIESFESQIAEKSVNFNVEKRKILKEQLIIQNENIILSESTKNHINLIENPNTFTITTGHQLNLFTGPIYYLYKIANTINLAQQLQSKYPTYNFVPIFWMATEDHDFEEINHFYSQNQKYTFNKQTSGIVGDIFTEGIQPVFEQFEKEFHFGADHHYLVDLFKKAYLEHQNLAEATRFLVNELFGKYGLVIIDGNDKELKKIFIPTILNELKNQISYQKVTETIELLKPYSIQANPREINLFYIEKGIRERIIFEKGKYKINNTLLEFDEVKMEDLVRNHPEKISPNALLRPVYQESILPNLAYIGGAGEMAYWLELKSTFEAFEVTLPILILRNSVVFTHEKFFNKLEKNHTTIEELFLKDEDFTKLKVQQFSINKFDFKEQKKFLEEQFLVLEKIALKTDKSFIGAVKAQERKQIKGLENLEKRLFKAEKRVHQEKLESLLELKNYIFPNGTFQERRMNFSEVYHTGLIDNLIKNLNPFIKSVIVFQ